LSNDENPMKNRKSGAALYFLPAAPPKLLNFDAIHFENVAVARAGDFGAYRPLRAAMAKRRR
jgi:hypothetical protein